MAIKKILISDNSGSKQEISTNIISYDDVLQKINVNKIIVNNISCSLQNGILQNNNNSINSSVISPINTPNSLVQFNGTNVILNHPETISGDLSGSRLNLNNVKVVSVANVNSGILGYNNGGTGLSANSVGLLLKNTNNSLQTLSATSDKAVIGFNSNGWFINYTDPTTNYTPRLDVYTSTSPNIIWNKIGNPRFLTICIVGAGGGGASGGTNNLYNGGAGGGGGGVTIITIEAGSIANATINVGAGGAGGVGKTQFNGAIGFAGGNGFPSSFACSVGTFTATGGGGGGNGPGGASGLGNYDYGTQSGAPSDTYDGATGGDGLYTSGGGSGAGCNSAPQRRGGDSGRSILLSETERAGGGLSAGQAGSNGYNMQGGIYLDEFYLNNSSTKTNGLINNIFGTGGGGGANHAQTIGSGGDGGHGSIGCGGGGGGNKFNSPTSYTSGYGGNGGSGVIMILSH